MSNEITKETRDKYGPMFDRMAALAENYVPNSEDYRKENGSLDAAAYNGALQEYRSNPLLPRLQAVWESSVKDAGGNENDAVELYHQRRNEEKERFLKGAQDGAPDEHAIAQHKSATDRLFAGDFMGALKEFLKGIPIVWTLLRTVTEMMNMFSNGESFDFGKAKGRVEAYKAMGGAAGNIGVDDKALARYGVDFLEHPPQSTADITEGSSAPVRPAFAASAASAAPPLAETFDAPNGTLPPPPVATPAAPAVAVAQSRQ